MRAITYCELIEMVAKGEQPKTIFFFDKKYKWKKGDYRTLLGFRLSKDVMDYITVKGLALVREILYYEV